MSQCWRDGNKVVVPRDGDLPESCVRCGGTAAEERQRTFSWTPGWARLAFLPALAIGGLPYFLLLAMVTEKSRIGFWLCEAHAAERSRNARVGRFGWLLLLAPILVPAVYVSASLVSRTVLSAPDVPWWAWIAIPLFGLVLAIYGSFATRILRATKIEPTLVWLSGVGSAFVSTLPTPPYR